MHVYINSISLSIITPPSYMPHYASCVLPARLSVCPFVCAFKLKRKKLRKIKIGIKVP